MGEPGVPWLSRLNMLSLSYDEQRLKGQVEEDTPAHEPPSAARDPSASDAVPASAPGDDTPPGVDAGRVTRSCVKRWGSTGPRPNVAMS